MLYQKVCYKKGPQDVCFVGQLERYTEKGGKELRRRNDRKGRAEDGALGFHSAICESHQMQGVFSAEGETERDPLTPGPNSSVHPAVGVV